MPLRTHTSNSHPGGQGCGKVEISPFRLSICEDLWPFCVFAANLTAWATASPSTRLSFG